MKNLATLFFALQILLFNTGSAQDHNTSTGAAPISKSVNHHTIITIPDNPSTIAYGLEYSSRSTLSMPIPAGTPFNTMNIFNPSAYPSSMVKGGNGNYYVVTQEPALFQFNSVNGAVTPIGAITGLSDSPNGISYNPVNGLYYLITSEQLYTFDIATRSATLIGDMGIYNSAFIDLCFNDAGACYAYDLWTNSAYIINTQNGAATLLGPLGYDPNYGQGMSYDMETGTIYLSAYDNTTWQGQLRKMDPGTGATTLLTSWANQQLDVFAVNTQYGTPCSITGASNQNPSNGASNVPVSGTSLTWTNGSGITGTEVWFGSTANVTKIYDGTAITSFALPVLEYGTKYTWWIVDKTSSCKNQSFPYTFTTQVNPNLVVAFNDPFDSLTRWSVLGPLGLTNWDTYLSNNAGGSPPSELMFFYDPVFNGMSKIISEPITSTSLYENSVSWRQYAEYYLGTPPIIGLAVTYDGGTTSTTLWEGQIAGQILPEQKLVTFTPTANTYRLIFYFNGNSYNINLWNIDDVRIDYIVPVELTSFTGTVTAGQVELQWSTSTETNNKGFEVQRSSGEEFQTMKFIEGNGTTTATQTYSYTENNLMSGKYSYRLKQIDFDGTFEYSNIVEVEVPLLGQYTLNQNYPNPFNPGTTISFSLAVDSKVSLKVFDLLGQEAALLIKSDLTAGQHTIDFDASLLNSGVYFYQIEAAGIDGTNFSDIKKMLLLK